MSASQGSSPIEGIDVGPPSRASRLRAYLGAVTLVLAAVAIASVMRRLPHANLSLLFLLAVLIVAAVWGLWPSIFASVSSFLALNFLFTPPLYTFTVEEQGDLASIVFFLAMAALTANLASRMRTEMAENRSALRRVSALLDFSGKMSVAVDEAEVMTTLARAIADTLRRNVAVWLPGADGRPERLAGAGAAGTFDPGDVAAVWSAGAAGVRGGVSYVPMPLSGSRHGLVGIDGGPLGDEARQFAEGLCEQASATVERILLDESLEEAQVVTQTEQLRSALLSSVSHDLMTPLASIIGSVSSVLEYDDKLRPEQQRELLRTVLDEGQRLNRYIQNLLDVTRFGQDRIDVRRDWVDLNDLVSAATERLGHALAGFDLVTDIAPDVALIRVHGALVEQALVNVLDNAIAFSEPGDAIRISARRDGDAAVIEVVDEGPGIAEEEREKIFEMFYTSGHAGDRRRGAGLGLAICRSLIEAHAGTIRAVPGPAGRGTCIRMRLPLVENSVGDGQA